MKLAIAQLNPTIGDFSGNAQAILQAAQDAVRQGVRLLLTPELSLCGYPPRDLLLQPGFIGAIALVLEQLAQDLPPQIAVLVGTVTPNLEATLTGKKPLYNSVALLYDGRVQQIFHKRLLPTYDVFDEDRYFEPGEAANQFTLDGVHVGVTICEDLWNDEEFWGKRNYETNPFAALAEEGVDLVVNLSASPYTVGKQGLREAMLQHGAVRYQRPVVYANQVGGNDDLLFDGSSVAFDRSGQLVCRAPAFQTALTLLTFDETTKDLQPAAIAPLLASPESAIWSALVMGVRDYARKCGFTKAVIGLSGGIDSSLVAAIATAALGAENVLGVLMPSPYSSDHSITDAEDLAQNLGIATETLPIGDLMQGYDRTFTDLFAGTEVGVAEENIQSRIRGNLLMAIANKFGHLLISTGNKSEMAVGYCTLYGDMNGGLAAIADVPKTQVYAICHWLNQQAKQGWRSPEEAGPFGPTPYPLSVTPSEIIPTHVLEKPPSAELKPGQTDQDSLPSYDILDDILHRLIHNHEAPSQIVAAGHDPETVDRVFRMVSRAEFKRRQAPPVLKITDRAFGTGWRMPIASRWTLSLTSTPKPQSVQTEARM